MELDILDEHKKLLLSNVSTRDLLESAKELDALKSSSRDIRYFTNLLFDEIERRVGEITLEEERPFETVYDSTGSYYQALVALRPQLAGV